MVHRRIFVPHTFRSRKARHGLIFFCFDPYGLWERNHLIIQELSTRNRNGASLSSLLGSHVIVVFVTSKIIKLTVQVFKTNLLTLYQAIVSYMTKG
jgi:hypothetical protein